MTSLFVVKEFFHLLAIRLASFAVGGVHNQSHMHFIVILSLLSLFLGKFNRLKCRHVNLSKLVITMGSVTRFIVTSLAIINIALVAMITEASQYISMAYQALGNEFRSIRVMNVIENHHTTMLSSAQLVELIVISGAQAQEILSSLEMLTLLGLIDIFSIVFINWNFTKCPTN